MVQMHILGARLSLAGPAHLAHSRLPEQPAVHGPLHQNVSSVSAPLSWPTKQRESGYRRVCGVTKPLACRRPTTHGSTLYNGVRYLSVHSRWTIP